MDTLVFKTGETDDGVIVVLVFTSDFIVTESELLTVCPLISTTMLRVCPALTPKSKA